MKASTKKLACLGLLAAGAGVAYLVLRKPEDHTTSGALVGLQVFTMPGQKLFVQPTGNGTNYGYVYPFENPLVALGRLRGMSLASPTHAPNGEPYLAFSTT